MLRNSLLAALLFLSIASFGQIKWRNVDSLYQPLPNSVHVFYTDRKVDTASFRAFYVIADLKDKNLVFTTDTSANRRLTPSQFYLKDDHPLLVVNGSFFSFETNRNLNLVIRDGKLIAYNRETIIGKGKDTFTFRHAFTSAIGITKNRKADIAWTFTDSSSKFPLASQQAIKAIKDSSKELNTSAVKSMRYSTSLSAEGQVSENSEKSFRKWKMQTAIGGGPVLVQNGEVQITNNEELKFAGKAINDKHPRTAMGYTADGKLIILAIQGRSESASGATLTQEAQLLKDLGCVEALNLDGGGSSCLLINGKETIKPSDKEGQRAVPAVFIIKVK